MTCEAHLRFSIEIVNIDGLGIRPEWVDLTFGAHTFHPTHVLILDLRHTFGHGEIVEQGVASAQFNLGVRYDTGWGVLKDSVLAHMWLNIAGANGNEVARENRDNLERDMTRVEISRATELARECMVSDYQDCAP